MLSTDKAFTSNKEVKSGTEKSSHLKSCSFSKLLSERQHTVLASKDLKSQLSPEQCFSILSFLAVSPWWKELCHGHAGHPHFSLPPDTLQHPPGGLCSPVPPAMLRLLDASCSPKPAVQPTLMLCSTGAAVTQIKQKQVDIEDFTRKTRKIEKRNHFQKWLDLISKCKCGACFGSRT